MVLGSLTFYNLHYKLAFTFIACPLVPITMIKLTWEKKGLQVHHEEKSRQELKEAETEAETMEDNIPPW